MHQLPLPYPVRPRYRPDDFLVSDANRDAWEWIHRTEAWPGFALMVHGPAGCGKTHLAHLWQARTGARFVSPDHLRDFTPDALPPDTTAYILEDLERASLAEVDQFHFLNTVKEQGGTLLLTAAVPPALLPIRLPDLRSRLQAVPAVALHAPDDALLTALLTTQLRDRQLAVRPEVIAFMIARMERSFAAVQALVSAIDHAMLSEKRPLTIPLVKAVMESRIAEAPV